MSFEQILFYLPEMFVGHIVKITDYKVDEPWKKDYATKQEFQKLDTSIPDDNTPQTQISNVERILNTMKIIKFFVEVRPGRNALYVLSNHSPAIFHKSRKFVVIVPKIDYSYFIIVSIICNDDDDTLIPKIEPVVSIHENTKKDKKEKTIFHFSNGEQEETFTFFLRLIEKTKELEYNVTDCLNYNLSVTLVAESGETMELLHEFDFTPTKSHKFESSTKGITQHKKNREIKITKIPIYFQ